MLTQSEKRWLKKRKEWSVCSYCSNIPQTMCLYGERPHFCALLDVDYKDAAEFSERVAAKLARWDNEYHKGDHLCPYGDDDLDSYIPLCHCINFCQDHPKLGCIAAKLAWARLAVEEEMDAGMGK